MPVNLKNEVAKVERRVASTEATTRFMLHVQMDQLKKAEKLRKLAADLLSSRSDHRHPSRLGGFTAVSEKRLAALGVFIDGLPLFHAAKGKMPPAVRKFLKTGRARKG